MMMKEEKLDGLNHYELMNYFSDLYKNKINIFCDTGCIVTCD